MSAAPPTSPLRAALDWPVPCGWSVALLGVAASLVLLQALTGVLLAAVYRPGVETSYASVAAIEADLAWGWLFRSVHSAAASALLGLAHLLPLLALWESLPRRRPLLWLGSVGLLGWAWLAGTSGYLLVGDGRSFSALQMAGQVLGGVPGGVELLLAGRELTDLTLLRVNAAHTLWLPLLFVAGSAVLLLWLLAVPTAGDAPTEPLSTALARSFWLSFTAWHGVLLCALVLRPPLGAAGNVLHPAEAGELPAWWLRPLAAALGAGFTPQGLLGAGLVVLVGLAVLQVAARRGRR